MNMQGEILAKTIGHGVLIILTIIVLNLLWHFVYIPLSLKFQKGKDRKETKR